MEKRRNDGKHIFFGLLNTYFSRLGMHVFVVILCLCGEKSFAVPRVGTDAQTLNAHPVSEAILTGEECRFTLFIPNTVPSSVRVEEPVLPTGAALKSLTRTQDAHGTQVELTLVFFEAGTYTPPPLIITVDGVRRFVPFAAAEVKKNPKDVLPALFARTDDGAKLDGSTFATEAGKPVMLTVYALNAAALSSFSWKAPKDALFTERTRFDLSAIGSSGGEEGQEIPLAQFEWIPFEAGLHALPEMRAEAETFSGVRTEVFLPETFVRVIHATKENETDSAQTLFLRAFDAASSNVQEKVVSLADCRTLAELRRAERRSFPWGAAKRRRIRFEKDLGLPRGKAEARFFTLFMLIGAAFPAAAAFCVAAARKKRARNAFFVMTAGLCAAISVYAANLFTAHGVYTGSAISAAPETNASTAPCRAGTVIRIKKSVGAWHYVIFPGGSGWVLQDDVTGIR